MQISSEMQCSYDSNCCMFRESKILSPLKEMVRRRLSRFNKKLTESYTESLGNEMDILLGKSKNPLYLVAACEVLRQFGKLENNTFYINQLPGSVQYLFEFLLTGWVDEYGQDFVQLVLGIICISKNGLLEIEIHDIMRYKEKSH